MEDPVKPSQLLTHCDNVFGQNAHQISASSSKSSLVSSTSVSLNTAKRFDVFVQFLETKGQYIIDCKSLVDGRSYSVQRTYEDFQALHEFLESICKPATIVPPLPAKFDIEEKQTPAEIVKTLSGYQIALVNATFFSLYLAAIVGHPTLGPLVQVEEFFVHTRFVRPEVESQRKVERGSLLLKYVSNKLKGTGTTHRDCDDYYENQNYAALLFDEKLQTMKENLAAYLNGNDKLSNVFSHLATCVLSTLVINAGESDRSTVQFNKAFCNSLDRYKTHLEASGTLADETFCSSLEYLFAYNLAYRQMLSRRGDLMVAYESANKNFQRLMNTKHHEKVSSEKSRAEREFELFNEAARPEIEQYHEYRREQLLNSVNRYVESQLAMSKHTVTLLKGCIANLKKV